MDAVIGIPASFANNNLPSCSNFDVSCFGVYRPSSSLNEATYTAADVLYAKGFSYFVVNHNGVPSASAPDLIYEIRHFNEFRSAAVDAELADVDTKEDFSVGFRVFSGSYTDDGKIYCLKKIKK